MSKVSLPKYYYNLKADLPELPPPPLHPVTGQPISPADLEGLFPKSLIEQEISTERFIEIPEKVRKAYAEYRPTPLKRAKKLEKYLNTPARIYFKYEGTNASGSHKLNTALAQAYFNKLDGTAYHRNRSRSVGERFSLCHQFFRAEVNRIYGRYKL